MNAYLEVQMTMVEDGDVIGRVFDRFDMSGSSTSPDLSRSLRYIEELSDLTLDFMWGVSRYLDYALPIAMEYDARGEYTHKDIVGVITTLIGRAGRDCDVIRIVEKHLAGPAAEAYREIMDMNYSRHSAEPKPDGQVTPPTGRG